MGQGWVALSQKEFKLLTPGFLVVSKQGYLNKQGL